MFIGVLAALIGGFVLHLLVYCVYMMALPEDVVEVFVLFRRYHLSRNWIQDLVNVLEAI